MAKKFPQFIEHELANRASNEVYSYSDLMLNWCYTVFYGGDYAEDIGYLVDTFQHLKGLIVPSPDAILAIETEFSTPVFRLVFRAALKRLTSMGDLMASW